MKKSTTRKATVTWGLALLGALSAAAAACGSPNWQNQYTETPGFTGAAEAPDGGAATDDAGAPPCPASSATCRSPLSSPSATVAPVVADPQGNPDPVPWSIHPIIVPRKYE